MCNRCIYKKICKLIENEMAKTAADTPCQRFQEIPYFNATENEELYLV